MACCVIVAFIINKLITTCEKFHIGLDIQYNDAFSNTGYLNKPDSSNRVVTKLALSGLTCAACVASVDRAVEKLEGVESVRTNLQLMQSTVFHNEKAVSQGRLKEAVEDLGYGAEVGGRSFDAMVRVLARKDEMKELKASFTNGTLLLTLLLGVGWMRLDTYSVPWMSFEWVQVGMEVVISGAIQWYCASFIYSNAWTAARVGRTNMDSLVALSNTLGILLSVMSLLTTGPSTEAIYFQTCAGLTVVVLGGRYLDALSRKKSAISLTSLYSNHAENALVRRKDGKRAVPASLLAVGDEITIGAYMTVPCDCYVVKGTSQVDESIITGESAPVSKTVGSLLQSGSRNGSNELTAVVYAEQDSSTLSTMINTITEATESKATSQTQIDNLMQYFVLGVVTLTVLRSTVGYMTLSPSLSLPTRLDLLGRRAMTMLMAACPCAIGLSIPSAVMAGIDAAWQSGILVTEGAAVMERLQKVTCIVMDKTGTLTEGILKVTHTSIVDPAWTSVSSTLSLLICAAEEPGAAIHPAGQAIFAHFLAEVGTTAWTNFKDNGRVSELDEVPGNGVACRVHLPDGTAYSICIGNAEMLQRHNISIPTTISTPSSESGIDVHIAISSTYTATVSLTDSPRPDAMATLSRLKSLRTPPLHLTMLTGDTHPTAQSISRTLGIPLLASTATPAQKQAHISTLQGPAYNHTVLMLGDGLNDSTALATADVGVMLCPRPTRCRTLGGTVLILSPRLEALADLFDVVDQTMRQVRSNLAWAVAYNVLAMGLALGLGEPLGVRISPAAGALLMSMSSVTIAVRSLGLRRRLVGRVGGKG